MLNPHVANCCVLRLDEQSATAVHDVLGEWLGELPRRRDRIYQPEQK